MGKKSTHAEIDARVSEIQTLLLEGRTRPYILQYASKWGLTDRQGDEYISRAYEALKEINKATVQETRAIVLGNLWESMRRCRVAGDERLAQSALEKIGKITGLEKTTLILEDKRDFEDLDESDIEKAFDEYDS